MEYIIHLAKKSSHAPQFKVIFTVFLSAFSFFFDPLQLAGLIALFILVMMDFFFGVFAARKTGDAIRSSKLRRTAIKLAVYFCIISAARMTEHAVPIYFLDTTVLGFLTATELLSILENTGRLGYAVPKKVVDALGDFINSKTAEKKKDNK